MKNHRRILALALTVILTVCLFALPVLADTASGGGLELTLTTDKSEYAADEQITAALTVKNTTEAPITNLVAEHIAPDGYGIASGDAKKTIASLGAGESATVEVTYGTGIPQTGDSGMTVVIVIGAVSAIALAALLLIDRKLRKNVMAMFLCCIMLAGLVVTANADELTDGITVRTTAKVNGTDITLSARVTRTDPVVRNGLTESRLDALPTINANEFQNYMNVTWNFGWEGNATLEHNATKVDFAGTADASSKIWRIGTAASEGGALVDNAGWGVMLWTKGAGNKAFMYSKLDVPETVTQFRIWAVGNTSEAWSGAGAFRAVALYKDESGSYVQHVLMPMADSFNGNLTTTVDESGLIQFSNAAWNMPDTLDGCMIIYDMEALKGRTDVVIVVEGVGIGETCGTADTEAAGGVANGEVMPDVVLIKRVMFL